MELFPSKTKFKPPKEKEGTDKVVVEVEISLETMKHPLRFKGSGNNKKQAKVAAAKCALRELRKAKVSK